MKGLVINMDTQQLLKQAEKILADYSTAVTHPEQNRIDVIISRDKLVGAVDTLETSGWGYLSAITGLDHSATTAVKTEEKQWEHVDDGSGQTGFGYTGSLEVLYHFCSYAAVATLRVQMSHEHPSVPSICDLIPSATLYERELIEMFGIQVVGTPNTDHLLLPDDWPADVYPLRKDFTGFDSESEEKEPENV
jgi:NADH:ubiquinone oxidoreductase subunit C